MQLNLRKISLGAGLGPATAVMAQEANTAAAESEAGELADPTATVLTALSEMWHSFLSHIPNMVIALVILLLTALIARIVRGVADRLLARAALKRSLHDLFTRLASIAVWVLGVLVAAIALFPGVSPGGVIGSLGIASVAIGFAFKDIFQNFFAGVLLMWKFPFEVGDHIEVEGVTGRIEDISIRMTRLRKPDGTLVLMPNGDIINNDVHVLTDRPLRRNSVVIGVGYDEDVERAVDVISRAVEALDVVADDEPLQVYPSGFGASSVDITVWWWSGAQPGEQRAAAAQVIPAIKKALDEAGIEIPYPYRTLTFREDIPLFTKQKNDATSTSPAG